MRNRIIINIRDETTDEKALGCVLRVVKEGRLSDDGNCYCYVAECSDGMMVTANRTQTSDVFNVWKGKVIE